MLDVDCGLLVVACCLLFRVCYMLRWRAVWFVRWLLLLLLWCGRSWFMRVDRCYLWCVPWWVLLDVSVVSYGCVWFIVCLFALFSCLLVFCGVLLRIGSGCLH